MDSAQGLFLGLDLSTQSLKAILINSSLEIVQIEKVNFQLEMPHYKTVNGVINPAPKVFVSPSMMFVEALDILLERLKKSKVRL